MENIEINQRAVQLLAEWDPFEIGADNYDTETADVVAALQGTSDVERLAQVIQEVYEHSFEEWIAFECCAVIARELIMLKNEMSCIL